jgi:hypothetical protein
MHANEILGQNVLIADPNRSGNESAALIGIRSPRYHYEWSGYTSQICSQNDLVQKPNRVSGHSGNPQIGR